MIDSIWVERHIWPGHLAQSAKAVQEDLRAMYVGDGGARLRLLDWGYELAIKVACSVA